MVSICLAQGALSGMEDNREASDKTASGAGAAGDGAGAAEDGVGASRDADVGGTVSRDADAGDTSSVPGSASFAMTPCPVAMPPDTTALEYQRTSTTERWRGLSEGGCEEVARGILQNLQAAGVELVTAGYLDLSGEAWGCTVACADGSSQVISLVPQALGQGRNENNRLQISVVRISPPKR
ncbi:MAG: hypothetical protein LBO07_07365 [Coriobacteriales bacterium]|nr:hypothetical protein [Coriobacteriales bacterium]